jgi:hypothetical protein
MCWNCYGDRGDRNRYTQKKWEHMGKRDAEIAIAMQIYNENPGQLTNEQAMKIGEEFIRDARKVTVEVETGKRSGKYQGGDPFVRRYDDGCF